MAKKRVELLRPFEHCALNAACLPFHHLAFCKMEGTHGVEPSLPSDVLATVFRPLGVQECPQDTLAAYAVPMK